MEEIIERYPNGRIRKKYSLVNGKKEGIETEYLSCGEKICEIPYKNGKICGTLKYYRNGKVIQETQYVDGKKNGLEWWIGYSHSIDLETYNEVQNENGKSVGVEREFIQVDSEKILIRETPFSQGYLNGIERIYKPKNKKKHYSPSDFFLFEETPYVRGSIDGVQINYYSSGRFSIKTHYVAGNKTRIETYLDVDNDTPNEIEIKS